MELEIIFSYWALVLVFFLGAVCVVALRPLLPGKGGWAVVRWFHPYGRMYHEYFRSETSLKADAWGRWASMKCQASYTSRRFEHYYALLDPDRLPLLRLLNLACTMADDILYHASPVLCVNKWQRHFEKLKDSKWTGTLPELLNYDAHELACIWGVVYLRLLDSGVSLMVRGELLEHIREVACPKEFVVPYFDYYVSLSEESLAAVAACPAITVMGDLVMDKHVEHEVNGVGAGGTGVSMGK